VLAEQIAEDVPTIVLNGQQDIHVFNKDLKNYHPGAVSQFDEFMDVDI
jgi:hypothetical protein